MGMRVFMAIAKTIAGLLCFGAAFLAVFVFGIPLYNDFLVWRFQESLRDLPHSMDAKVVSSNSDFGVLWGAGNHCDVTVHGTG